MAGIQAVGSGYDRPEAVMPVDVQSSALLSWLTDRDLLPTQLQQVRSNHLEKARKMAADAATKWSPTNALVAKAVADAGPGGVLMWPHCISLWESLLQTESTAKTFFGKYSNPILAEWNDVITAYQQKGAHLLELADELVSITKYDVPAMRKEISVLQKEASHFQELSNQSKANANKHRQQYKQLCSRYRIEGKNVRKELKSMPLELSEIFAKFTRIIQGTEKSKKIEQAISYYQSFSALTNPSGTREDDLPLLSHILKYGNETFKSKRERESPATAIEPNSAITPNLATNPADVEPVPALTTAMTTSTSSTTSTSAPSISIDWSCLEVPDEGLTPAELSLDLEDTSPSNFEIEVVESDTELSSATEGNQTKFQGKDDETLLMNSSFRNALLCELEELCEFLLIRKRDIGVQSHSSNLLEMVPKDLPSNTVSDISKFTDCVKEALDFIQSPRVYELLQLWESPNYVERIACQFDTLTSQALTCDNTAKSLTTKSESTRKQAEAVESKARESLGHAKHLAGHMQKALESMLHRQVTVLVG
ncbi:CDK5 regulatory subunit-associated protein 3 [Pelomyxa schiedti]|nr:CDK5 regulatory subunit-associated protein 3 [Pelomyxa schiedti]